MSKLDAKVFSSITPFSKQWILGEDTMYDFLYQYQDFLSDSYGIIDLGTLNYGKDSAWEGMFGTGDLIKLIQHVRGSTVFSSKYINAGISSFANMPDMSVQVMDSGSVYFKNINAWNSMSQEEFKAAMSGVYLVFRLADNVKRNTFIFNKANQDNIAYIGLYSDLQTFYTNIGETEHIASANIYLTSSNKNWVYKNYNEVDHSYRLQHGTKGFENISRAYVFLTADNEAAAREIINNDPVIVYCYYVQ